MTDPMSFFNIPANLGMAVPPTLASLACAVLVPLGDGSLDIFNPSVEDLVSVLESSIAITLGMGYGSATAQSADTVTLLLIQSKLIDIERHETCGTDEGCQGSHAVKLTDKGREFIKAFKATRDGNGHGGSPRSNLKDRLEQDADDFMKGWDETNN